MDDAIKAAVSVRFSPHGGCTEALVEEVEGARKSIRVLSYNFTSPAIAGALIRARARGVDVRIVLDHSMLGSHSNQGDECQAAGIPVLYDAHHKIAHNKIVIVDGKVVVGGSFNHTESAESHNAENLTISSSRALAALFSADWDLHAAHSHPAPPAPRPEAVDGPRR